MKRTLAILLAALLLCGVAASCAAEAAVYTGSGKGNNGEIQGALTVENGAITACEVVSHSETPGICDAALEQIPAAVISAQSAEVDTVTGATNTSHGILEAVADAMQQAGLSAAEEEATAEAPAERATADELSERLFGESRSPLADRLLARTGAKYQQHEYPEHPVAEQLFKREPRLPFFDKLGYRDADKVQGVDYRHDRPEKGEILPVSRCEYREIER